MKIALTSSAVLILLSSVVSALPQSPNLFSRQTTTPDGTCGLVNSGAGKGYSCPTSNPCCSQWGWCGTSTDHCGTGCQSGYGTCTTGGGGTTPPPTGTSTTIIDLPASSSTTSLVTSLSTSTSTSTSTVSTSSSLATSSTTSSTTSPSSTGTIPTIPGGSRPKFGSVPYGSIITECTRPNSVAITFDDGPHIYTKTLLDYYNSQGVKATFFVNGANWGPSITSDASKQDLIREMIATGHQVASHTWSHPDLSTLSYDGVRSQMSQLEVALYGIIGKYPTYMRPPFLSCGGTCLQALGDMGYHVMSTNLDTQDWRYNTADTYWQSQKIFKDAVTPVGSAGRWLVLAHDVHEQTALNIARYLIKKSREVGLNMVTVGECMQDPPANWYRTTL